MFERRIFTLEHIEIARSNERELFYFKHRISTSEHVTFMFERKTSMFECRSSMSEHKTSLSKTSVNAESFTSEYVKSYVRTWIIFTFECRMLHVWT